MNLRDSFRAGFAPLAGGTLALLITGVNPLLLDALWKAGRLSAAGEGQAAMIELLAMGVAAGGAGAALNPSRLKLIGALAGLVIAAANLATLAASGGGVLAARGVAGLAEGLLIWISIGFIVRQANPERWAGVYFLVQTLTQLALTGLLGLAAVARFGPAAGFTALAVAGLAAALIALTGPSAFAPLPKGEGLAHLPNRRGWIALGAVLLYVAGGVGVWIYLGGLADRAGLVGVAGGAVAASLMGQVLGSAAATVAGERLRYVWVFLVVVAVHLAAWSLLAGQPTAALFIACFGATGLTGMFVSPYFVPLLIEADPSRRAGELAGGAQLLGSALGPFVASMVVSEHEPRGALMLGAGFILVAFAIVVWLAVTRVRSAPA